MIISLSENENSLLIPSIEKTDVICFFRVENSISTHESLWWDSLCTSLRLKRSVVILEEKIDSFPKWDESKRWQVGDNWSWLSPRSLSVISNAYPNKPTNYPEFKAFLTSSK